MINGRTHLKEKKTKEQEKGKNSSETDSLLVDPVIRKEEEKTVSQSVSHHPVRLK